MKTTDQTQPDMSPLNDSEKSPSYSEESCSINNNTLTSFLHRLRQMPPQKQQQLVSTSVAIVRNSGTTTKPNGNCTSNVDFSQREIEPLTNDKVFEVVYSVRDNYILPKTEKNEKQGIFMDTQERIPKVEKIVEKQSAFLMDAPERLSKTEKIVEKQAISFFVDSQERQTKTERIEKQGMCFVVDAHERRVRIVGKDEMRKQQSRLILLEDLPEDELSRFGTIFDEDDVENTDKYVHCDLCDLYYNFCCLEHPLYQCQDRDPTVSAQNSPSKDGDDRASLTIPGFLYIQNSSIPNAGKGVFAKVDIPIGIVFGPYEGILLQDPKKASQDGYSWELRVGNGKPSYYIDAKDPQRSNWMRYINSPRHENEQNLIAFQYRGSVFYRVYRPIDKNSELLVWYASRVKGNFTLKNIINFLFI
jgi:hypothetical protein